MVMVHKNYISGRWISSDSGNLFSSDNPADELSLGKFQASTRIDIQHAITSAQIAFKSWKDTPAPHRAKNLFKMRDLLIEHKERLARLIVTEMGKVISEARGDVQEAIDIFEYMAGEGKRMFGHTTPSELREKFAMTIRLPIGVVGLITPWNFPIAIPAWKSAAALICGNTVVWKPSSDTPLCAVEFTKLIAQAGFPHGTFNMVTGSGEELGDELVKNQIVRGISFTGSRDVGEKIISHAGIKRVGLELGGKNAIIVMDDADLDLAVDGVVWGAFGTTGQRCTATSRVIVHEKVKKEFERKLVSRVKKLTIGDGLRHDIGPLINDSAVEKCVRYVGRAHIEQALLIHGGKNIKIRGKGNFFEPTIFTNCKPSMSICQDEIFGPILAIIPVKNFDEAIRVANGVSYGLSSAIYTRDITKAFQAVQKIEAGLTYVNSSTIGSECHLPFGGVKGTGNGTREAGIHGIDEFSEIKTVYFDYSGKLQKATIDEEINDTN
ncbi:MAG: aldehyde dehydrogenase family protein [Candidatus Pacearchaeota archaeon]